jgi:hypothetical protein
MSPLQKRIAAITDTTTNLTAQLRELDLLRERVRKAQQSLKMQPSLKRRPRPKRRNGNAPIPPESTKSEPPTALADLPIRRLPSLSRLRSVKTSFRLRQAMYPRIGRVPAMV